jgi:hypothetical protein
VAGEIEIAGIEPGRLAAHVGEHRRAQVIDHHPAGNTQRLEGIDVGGEEVLHALRQGEFHIELAAVGQHHDEERQAPAGVAHGDAAPLPPVEPQATSPGAKARVKKAARGRGRMV